jgi:uncharacterized protein YndB with AHSA1/START domain
MILEETTLIDAPPERVFDFFLHMDEQRYLDWHPDHLAFRWVEGNSLQEGSVCYFEERIYGKVNKKKVRYTKVEPNRYVEFVPTWWLYRLLLPRMSFAIERQEDNATLLRAQVHVRVGPLGAKLNREEFDAVRQHMQEEGENLKKWAEQPEPEAAG